MIPRAKWTFYETHHVQSSYETKKNKGQGDCCGNTMSILNQNKRRFAQVVKASPTPDLSMLNSSSAPN